MSEGSFVPGPSTPTGAGLSSSLAAALGARSAEGAPAAPPPSARRDRLQGFRALRLPEPSESGIGEIAQARRMRERRDLATPSALIKRAMEDWPGQAAEVAALAVAAGVQRGEMWRRVIAAGIACLRDDEETRDG